MMMIELLSNAQMKDITETSVMMKSNDNVQVKIVRLGESKKDSNEIELSTRSG
jgi:hypothetical protein